jgi:endonuclease YncB( thermonuclease family)
MPSPSPLFAAALAGLALLAACQRKEAPLSAAPPPSIVGHVRVLSADVLIIDGKHLRLANAYAPESLLQARCWAESLASDYATQFTKDLVDHARTYDFKVTGKTDEYNRQLATVSIDGADLGDMLYNQGLAAHPTDPRFNWCDPVSKEAPGAPKISTLYAPGQGAGATPTPNP